MKIKFIHLLILVFAGLLFSCEMNKNNSDLELKNVSDLKGKFEIGLPVNWQKEFNSYGFSSGLISSDTSKELEETIIINVNWNQDTIYINSHLEEIMDSLNMTVGLETKMKKSGRINDYRTYFNYSYGLDSVTNLQINQLLYILKSDSLHGHVLFTARIYGDSVSKRHSELIAAIVESIKMKK